MKNKVLVIIATVAFIVVAMSGLNNVIADAKAQASGTAVVSVPKIMQTSLRAQALQAKVLESRDAGLAEIQQMKAQIQVVRADLEARKPGSEEFAKLKKDYMVKNASLEAQKEYIQQELMLKNQHAMEELYQNILVAVEQVAKAQGYELILDKDSIDFPSPSPSELSLSIQTHKVLYHADYMDITDKVVEVLDK